VRYHLRLKAACGLLTGLAMIRQTTRMEGAEAPAACICGVEASGQVIHETLPGRVERA